MATDPQTLFNESTCFLCFEISEDEALELALLVRILNAGFGPVAPNAPTNLLVRLTTTLGNNILDWTASSGTAPTTYEIWRSVNGGAFAQVGTVAGGVTTFTHAVAVPLNDQWYYEVRACTGGQCSAFTDPAGIFNTFSKMVNNGTVVYSFPFLQFVFNDFGIGSQLALTTVSVPRLRKTTGQFILINNDVLTSIDASSLISGNGVGVTDSTIIASVSFPALTTAGAYFALRDNPGLTTATAPLLAIISGPLQFSNTTALTSLSLPSLTIIGGDIDGSSSGITSLSLPALTTVGGNLTCASNTFLTSVTFTVLNSVAVGVFMGTNTTLANLAFPSLVNLGADFHCENSTNLVTLSIPNLIFQDGGFIMTADSCLLNVASVNGVLARGVASGTTTNDYELNSPGNAPPNGQGLLDKATLIGLGNTVNTN